MRTAAQVCLVSDDLLQHSLVLPVFIQLLLLPDVLQVLGVKW